MVQALKLISNARNKPSNDSMKLSITQQYYTAKYIVHLHLKNIACKQNLKFTSIGQKPLLGKNECAWCSAHEVKLLYSFRTVVRPNYWKLGKT